MRAQPPNVSNSKVQSVYNSTTLGKTPDNKAVSQSNTKFPEENKEMAISTGISKNDACFQHFANLETLKITGVSQPINGTNNDQADAKKEHSSAEIIPEEKRLIAMYFKHRFHSFLRLAQEKAKQFSQFGAKESYEVNALVV